MQNYIVENQNSKKELAKYKNDVIKEVTQVT